MQLQRELGVTYKTAWRMFNKIRNELMDQDDDQVLTGPAGAVELDETYVGGKPRATDRAKWQKPGRTVQSQAVEWAHDKKTPVFGVVERNQVKYVEGRQKPIVLTHGKVQAQVVKKTEMKASIVQTMDDHVKPDTIIYTDDSRVYDWVAKEGWTHHKVRHSRGSYVRDTHTHTQQIEGFWSLLKCGINGSYHAVSPKWLQGYVNEYVWRYNHREDGREMFAALVLRSAFPLASR